MILTNNPDLRLEVIGNTDMNGDADYNKELAKKRANSVITYLSINFKIDENRFKSTSNGEEKPLSTESVLKVRVPVKIPYQKLTEESILELLNNFIIQIPQKQYQYLQIHL